MTVETLDSEAFLSIVRKCNLGDADKYFVQQYYQVRMTIVLVVYYFYM